MGLQAGDKMFKLVSHREYAAKLKAARTMRELTATVAAESHGLSQPQLSKIENGQQTHFTGRIKDKVEALAKDLGVEGMRFVAVDWADLRQKESPRPKEPAFSAKTAQVVTSGAATPLDRVARLLALHNEGLIPAEAALVSIRAVVG
jgi:hypothetical protein